MRFDSLLSTSLYNAGLNVDIDKKICSPTISYLDHKYVIINVKRITPSWNMGFK